MPDSIRLWSVTDGDALRPVGRQPVDLEARLEDWMESDIDVLSDDLLVIGRQLDTQGGGILDLLCIDRSGDLVVVELKRGKTPRDVVAQALDYAAWVVGLSYDAVCDLARQPSGVGLAEAFEARFGTALPDVLNAEHRIVIVASQVDERTERIIRYLNDAHGVAINAVTFNYFQDADGRELLARTHLIEPEVVEERAERRAGSKRRRRISLEAHRRAADELGLADVFDALLDGMGRHLSPQPRVTLVTLAGDDGAAINVVPLDSTPDGLRVNVYSRRLGRPFGLDADAVRALLPADAEPWSYAPDTKDHTDEWTGHTCTFSDVAAVDRLVQRLDALA